MKHTPWMMLLALTALMASSCESRDERLADYAERSNTEQAAQNRTTADMTRETAENQRRVVETVEKSRQDLVGLQQDLSQQQSSLDQERRDLAQERHRESLLAPVLTSVGFLLVSALPLVLCWYLLHTLKDTPVDESSVTQLLVQDLVADQPVLLPPPAPSMPSARRITHAIPEPPKIAGQPPSP